MIVCILHIDIFIKYIKGPHFYPATQSLVPDTALESGQANGHPDFRWQAASYSGANTWFQYSKSGLAVHSSAQAIQVLK